MTTLAAQAEKTETGAARGGARRRWLRLIPLLAVGGIALFALVAGRDLLSFAVIEENREQLIAWRDANPAVAATLFALLYVAVVVFSIPGAVWVSIAGGFLFGTWVGTALNVASATTGATLLFLVARSSFGAWLRERAAGWAARAAEGIERDQVSYLLLVRLVPAMPFFVANLIPAFFRVRPWTFVWTTFAGIIPAAIVFTSFGAGIGELLDRGERPDLGELFAPEFVLPLAGLMLLALLPAVLRRLRARRH